MKTIIVPVDFSDVSINAALYAASLAHEYTPVRIVIYHSTALTINDLHEPNAATLPAFTEDLMQQLKARNNNPEYIIEINELLLPDGIEALCSRYENSLIVMGITGRGTFEQKVIGSNTLKLAHYSHQPLLIIPPAAVYQPITRVALALQFRERLQEVVPAEEIIQFTQELDAQLLILNIDNDDHDTIVSYVNAGQHAAHLLFDTVKATFHFVKSKKIAAAVATFAKEQNAQVIVSIAGEHSFFSTLFKGSVTQSLAYHSPLPLLVVQQSNNISK